LKVDGLEVSTRSHFKLESTPLPGPAAVISMADSPGQVAKVMDAANVRARLTLIFNDATEGFQHVRPPSLDDARRILEFVDEHRALPYLVIQCQVGIGRSRAVAAAILRRLGQDYQDVLELGTYNRLLYRLLLEASGLPQDPEPLVSLNVRVKYPPDRLRLLLLSMKRQRYDNWEVVAVTDGPNPAVAQMVAEMNEPRVRVVETEQQMGNFGHAHRQRGLDACRGEIIGITNDDNYFTPGYLEQMVAGMVDADLALCGCAQSHRAWSPTEPPYGIGSWLARASLVRRLPWIETHPTADLDYTQKLVELAGNRVTKIARVLFVHN
jgi:predicted protein tyrosine phosphatase